MNGVAWIMLVLAAIVGVSAAAGALALLLLIACVAEKLTRDDDNRGDY